jgi:hypothetical protein
MSSFSATDVKSVNTYIRDALTTVRVYLKNGQVVEVASFANDAAAVDHCFALRDLYGV